MDRKNSSRFRNVTKRIDLPDYCLGRWPIGGIRASMRKQNIPRAIDQEIAARLEDVLPTVIPPFHPGA
jgi:hypothetical protein